MLKELDRVKANLFLEHPLFGMFLIKIPVTPKENIGTAYTNGKEIFVDPKFWEKLSLENKKFLLAHEVAHIYNMHFLRGKGRKGKKWNIATDLVINSMLRDFGVGEMIKGGLISDKYTYKMSAEEVYREIPDPPDDENGIPSDHGGNSDGGDNAMGNISGQYGTIDNHEMSEKEFGKMSESEKQKMKQEIKSTMAKAKVAMKMRGKLSADMESMIDEIINPGIDFKALLFNYVENVVGYDNTSWNKFNRRYLAQDLYLPTMSSEKIIGVVAIDTSGSMMGNDIKLAVGGLFDIMRNFGRFELTVYEIDTEVHRSRKITENNKDEFLKNLNVKGGGGTVLTPVFDKIKKDYGNRVNFLIFFSDLYATIPSKQPPYPVIWVSTSDQVAPWGVTIRVKDGIGKIRRKI